LISGTSAGNVGIIASTGGTVKVLIGLLVGWATAIPGMKHCLGGSVEDAASFVCAA
jgi:hypothetical protein